MKNLESTICLVCSNLVKINELPNADCVRKIRGAMRIVTETLAIYCLAKDQNWLQLQWNRTLRRTTLLATLAAGIKEARTMILILISSSYVTLGGTSEETAAAIAKVIEAGKDYLSEWKETVKTLHPDFDYDISGTQSPYPH